MPQLRVVFVCLGNICRSPMAEVICRTYLAEAGLADDVTVASAGTGDWHVGEPADDRAAAALTAAGYEPGQHQARQFRPGDFARYDLVLALDASNERALRRLAPDAESAAKIRLLRSYDPTAATDPNGLDVPDPYHGGAEGFARVLAQLERACRGLVDDLGRHVRQAS